MTFERIQKQTHIIAGTNFSISYDRFTTRLEIKSEKETIYSSLLIFRPIQSTKVIINNQAFTLKIFWLILWRSKLIEANKTVIHELLDKRRRQSIGLLIYVMLISSIKISIGLMA